MGSHSIEQSLEVSFQTVWNSTTSDNNAAHKRMENDKKSFLHFKLFLFLAYLKGSNTRQVSISYLMWIDDSIMIYSINKKQYNTIGFSLISSVAGEKVTDKIWLKIEI